MNSYKYFLVILCFCFSAIACTDFTEDALPISNQQPTIPSSNISNTRAISELTTPVAFPSPTVTPTSISQEHETMNTPTSTTLRPLTPTPTPSTTPSVIVDTCIDTSSSSHLAEIAFTAEWDGDEEIYLINTDGTGLLQVTHNEIDDWDPVWSPDGNSLAYMSGDRNEGDIQLVVVSLDRNEVIYSTPSNISILAPIDWATDSQKITFSASGDIYVVNIADGLLTNLTNGSVIFSIYPTWSPTEQRIAFEGVLDTKGIIRRIHTIDVTTFYIDELASFSFSEFSPQWHPFREQILFISWENPGISPQQLQVTTPDGNNRQLLIDSPTHKSMAQWSPDGLKIAYKTLLLEFEENRYVVQQSDVQVYDFISKRNSLVFEADDEIIEGLTWSKDSRYLYLLLKLEETVNIYLMDSCTSIMSRIVDDVSLFQLAETP